MSKRVIIYSGALLALIVLALTVAKLAICVEKPTTLVKVKVVFVGYTNGAKGERLASFKIKNEGSFALSREAFWNWQYYPQQFERETHQLSIPRVSLRHNESEVISFPVPNCDGKWRAGFIFVKDDLKRKFSEYAGGSKYLPGWIDRNKLNSINAMEGWSDWVDR